MDHGIALTELAHWSLFAQAWRRNVDDMRASLAGSLPATARVAVITDVHGMATALEAVLRSAFARGATQVWCLGDVVGRGPSPRTCVEMLTQLGPDVVSHWLVGNHERMWLRGPTLHDDPDVVTVMEQHHIPALSRLTVRGEPPTYSDWTWPVDAVVQPTSDSMTCYLVHGGAPRGSEAATHVYTDDLASVLRLREHADRRAAEMQAPRPRLLLAGHTHEPGAWRIRGPLVRPQPMTQVPLEVEVPLDTECTYLNVGSSGGWQRGRDMQLLRPTFGLLNFGAQAATWQLVAVDANLEAERTIMRGHGYPQRIVESLCHSAIAPEEGCSP